MSSTYDFRMVDAPGPGPPDGRSCGNCHGCSPSEDLLPAVSPVAVTLGAIGLFLIPICLAVAGAWWGRAEAVTQLAGGLLGLSCGMGLAWAGGRFLSICKETTQ